MAKSKKRASKVNKLAAMLIVVLVLLIFTSVAATLMVTGVLSIDEGPKTDVASILDAQYVCDDDIKREYGKRVRAFYPDDHSSRFDARKGLYLMFYELHLYDNSATKKEIKKFYVNCFVSPKKGRVVNLELLEHTEDKPKAVRRTKGNAFGL